MLERCKNYIDMAGCNAIHSYSNWGESLFLIDSACYGIVRLSKYKDDNDAIVISDLNVDDRFRNIGIGKQLIQLAEELIFNICKMKYAQLCAEKNSWLVNWYKRMGYKEVEQDNEYIYLEKENTNNT